MYDELIKRLKYAADIASLTHPTWTVLMTEAADAIEELRAKADLHKEVAEEYRRVNMMLIDKFPQWIPVTERLPENGAEVLAWSESGFSYVDWWIDGKWKVCGLVDGKYEHVTHWMPLPPSPEPPKEIDN